MISTALINAAIGKSKGTTFVSAKYESPVPRTSLSQGFKDKEIIKLGFMHGIAFATVNDYRNAYEAAVKRDLERSGDSDGAERFTTQSNWFRHSDDDAFSIVRHSKDNSRAYLYVLPRGGSSRFFNAKTGNELTREEVAAMMTPSSARKLLDTSKVRNVTHGVTHGVQCRVMSLSNIRRLRIMGHTLLG